MIKEEIKKAFGRYLFIFLLGILVLNLSGAYNANTFVNGLTNESLTNSDIYCYQEIANQTSIIDNICGLNYTGGYYITNFDEYFTDNKYSYDGDWLTSTQDRIAGDGRYEVNYSIPNDYNISKLSIWQIKTKSSVSNDYYFNITINSSMIFNSKLRLLIKDVGGSFNAYYIDNSNNEIPLLYQNFGGYNLIIYEEAMVWRVSNTIRYLNLSLSYLTNAYINLTDMTLLNINPIVNLTAGNIPPALAYYSFQEGSGASSVTNYNANLFNLSVNSTDWNSGGYFGNALRHAGYNTGAIAPANATYNTLLNSNNLTVNLWLKTNQSTTAQSLVDRGSFGAVTNGWGFSFGTSRSLAFIYGNGVNQFYCTYDNAPITDNNYHMLTAVYNTTEIMIYIDGQRKTCTSIAKGTTTTTRAANMNIGKRIDANDQFLNGTIDEIGIWNISLTSTEISNLYNYVAGSILAPINISIKMADKTIFNYTGFNFTNFKTPNLALSVNNYTKTCIYNNNICQVPFNFILNGNDILDYHDLIFNNYGIIENNQIFNKTSTETTPESYAINISFDSSNNQASALFVYNGTIYANNIVKSGNEDNIKFDITINTKWAGNYSFYWIIMLNNGTQTNYTSNVYYQNILSLSNITVSLNCPSGLVAAYNFTFSDEVNLSKLNGSINYNIAYGIDGSYGKIINGNMSNIDKFSICINNSNAYYEVGYGEIQYYDLAGVYVMRRYYLFTGSELNNNTQTITLYHLLTSLVTPFQFLASDNNLRVYTNDYIALLKWFPTLNSYYIVDMAKTDDTGQTVLNLKQIDTDYRQGLYYPNGTLIKLFNATRFLCTTAPCTFDLKNNLKGNNYNDFMGVQQSLTYDYNLGIWTYTFNDPSQKTSLMNLTVYKDNPSVSFPVCSSSLNNYYGVITCNTSIYTTGTLRAEVYRSASPSGIIAQKIVNIEDTPFTSTFGLWLSIIVGIPIMVAFAAISPVVALIGGIVALFPAYIFGSISLTIIGGFGILAAILAHFLKKVN